MKSPYTQNTHTYLKEPLSSPSSKYLIGWSHGKEALKTGSYDTLKGSYYVNCAPFFHQKPRPPQTHSSQQYQEYTGENIWPREDLLPGFRQTFEELCTLIIEIASLVARACDDYAVATISGYEPGCLQNIVETSTTTKARLLHYFPQERCTETQPAESSDPDDSWCATHVDHGCLTALTSALYIDESAHPPILPSLPPPPPQPIITPSSPPPPPLLPPASTPPSSSSGLYIQSRTSTITHVTIPSDCLAFQTGEALQLITGGRFRAVPHFVRAGDDGNGKAGGMEHRIARNTLAIFTQPALDVVVDQSTGKTFGEFCKEVAGRFG